MTKRKPKATNMPINQLFLDHRFEQSKKHGYSKQKWIEFCEIFLGAGYKLSLYEARRSMSKYITVVDAETKREFKVRFSNHKPIKSREYGNDCDFFVGRTNTGVRTTQQAIKATKEFFERNEDNDTSIQRQQPICG